MNWKSSIDGRWIAPLAVFACMAILLARQVDLTRADLGRHLTNGAVILQSSSDRWPVLDTNFYSYTQPGQPFLNHHWLTGVVFYALWNLVGFPGLSVSNILLVIGAAVLFFDVARRAGNFWLATAVLVAMAPLITLRADVRPESFTCLLTAVFSWILWQWRASAVGGRWLYGLPVVMLFWVNLHIGFVFGFLVMAAFLLDAVQKKSGVRPLLRTAGLCTLAALANPHFVRGLLYPLSIFDRYGYRVVENQSIPYLERLGLASGQPFLLFEIAGAALLVAAILNFRRLDLALVLPAVVAGVMAFFAIRHFATFALFALPALVSTVPRRRWQRDVAWIFVAAAIGAAVWHQVRTFPAIRPALGLGLMPGVEDSARFFRQNRIAGPIFNNYDIGGYLIYELSRGGQDKAVFVDNRPEGYTVEFLQNIYIPAQSNEAVWQQLQARYRFNAIFFSHRDYTPWAKAFLVNRAKDPAWAPVFADAYNIVFLRRDNPDNASIIQAHLIGVRTSD